MADSVYVQEGRFLDYTPSGAAVDAGDVVLLSSMVTIAPRDIADLTPGSVQVDGVWLVQKTTSEAWALGEPLYWVSGTGKFSTTKSTNKTAGFAAKAAGSADTTGYLLLRPAVDLDVS